MLSFLLYNGIMLTRLDRKYNFERTKACRRVLRRIISGRFSLCVLDAAAHHVNQAIAALKLDMAVAAWSDKNSNTGGRKNTVLYDNWKSKFWRLLFHSSTKQHRFVTCAAVRASTIFTI